MEKISVLLADDHDLVRQGLCSLLKNEAIIGEIAEACNGHEAVLRARTFKPQVVLMDYEMPNFNGIYAAREILKENPDTPIILLSAHQSREHIFEGVYAGVRGYLPKEARIGELISAIIAVAEGGTWFKGKTAELMAPYLLDALKSGKNIKGHRSNEALSAREQEILRLFAEGLSARQIADKLSVSKRTVDAHKSNIFKKLHINNIVELVRYAVKQDLIRL